MALIKCDNISLGYEGRTILKDLNFSLNGGEYLCIVGENGAGKSTLIKTILGLKKPMKGTIETGDNLKRTEIGYMPQQTDAQKDFPASVYEVVISGRLNSLGMKPFFGRRDKADVMDKLRLMGIENLKNKCNIQEYFDFIVTKDDVKLKSGKFDRANSYALNLS